DLGFVEGDPGRAIWGPDPNEKNGDEGDEEGEGRPDRRPGNGQGNDPNDPSWVEIPDDLYAEALAAAVELPRLRPKGGKMDVMEKKREGGQHKRDGSDLMDRIMKKAYER